MDNAEFRVLSAMLKAGLKRKAKLDPVVHARRVAVESELQARRYCDAFALWRQCRDKRCRRRRGCVGDAHACVKRAAARVPQPVQVEARQRILGKTPHNIAAPEREARQRMPRDLYGGGRHRAIYQFGPSGWISAAPRFFGMETRWLFRRGSFN